MKKSQFAKYGLLVVGIIIAGYLITLNSNETRNSSNFEHKLDNSNLVIIESKFSSNNDYKLITYQFDTGAFGYSRLFWSVIENKTSSTDLKMGLLPDGYKSNGWNSKNELVLEIIKSNYFHNSQNELKTGNIINGNKIKLKE